MRAVSRHAAYTRPTAPRTRRTVSCAAPRDAQLSVTQPCAAGARGDVSVEPGTRSARGSSPPRPGLRATACTPPGPYPGAESLAGAVQCRSVHPMSCIEKAVLHARDRGDEEDHGAAELEAVRLVRGRWRGLVGRTAFTRERLELVQVTEADISARSALSLHRHSASGGEAEPCTAFTTTPGTVCRHMRSHERGPKKVSARRHRGSYVVLCLRLPWGAEDWGVRSEESDFM